MSSSAWFSVYECMQEQICNLLSLFHVLGLLVDVKKMDLASHSDVIVLPASRMQVIDALLEFILLLQFYMA
jgi:hypothetical protein